MYRPQHFAENDAQRLQRVIWSHPLAILAHQGDGGPDADHLPLLFAESADGMVLRGHVARGNPLARRGGAAVLAIFRGPEAYVSPSWYPAKAEHGRVVPTWNYVVVHAYGRLRTVDDPEWIRRHLEALTVEHEAAFERPWRIDDAPADFIDRLVGAVVGIEIVVERLEGKFKLGQNRDVRDRKAVADALRASGDDPALRLAEWMAGLEP
jgi:transcriptional regulator